MHEKTFILYARKSTDDTTRQARSIDDQIAELSELARRENLKVIDVLVEKQTAKKPGRPIFNAMLDCIERGEASGILAWHPDRLARNSVDGGRLIYLVDTGMIKDLRFPTFTFEPSPSGKFMLSIMFGQSKYYVDNLSENIKRGLRQKAKNGIFPTMPPLGYLNDRLARTVVLDKERAPLIRKMFELHATGTYTLDRLVQVITDLGLLNRQDKPLSRPQFYRLLHNPMYCGIIRYAEEDNVGKHEPIIDKVLFDKVQMVMQQKAKLKALPRHFMYRGVFRCGECGAFITSEVQKGNTYLRCTKKKGPCSQKFLRQDRMDEQVTCYLGQLIISSDKVDALVQTFETERQERQQRHRESIDVLRTKLREAEARMSRLMNAYLEQAVGLQEFRQVKAGLVSEQRLIEDQIVEIERDRSSWLEPAIEFVKATKQAVFLTKNGSCEERRDFLKKVGSNFEIRDRHLSVNPRGAWKLVVDQGSFAQRTTAPLIRGAVLVGETRHGLKQAERGRFDCAILNISREKRSFVPISLPSNALANSRCSSLTAVVHRWRGRQQGQNRDKRPNRLQWLCTLAVIARRDPSGPTRKRSRGCIYARYSTRFQHSIEDQVRACKAWAAANGIDVDCDRHIFSDMAESGKKRRRPGLERMLQGLDEEEFDTVITFATNRLHRKIHRALQFVEESIVEKRRRCVFVVQNIDTANTKFWKQLLYVFAMLDEMQVTMSAGHVRAAHEGLLINGFVHGTITFGYTGVPTDGSLTRLGKPRLKLAVDPQSSPWVIKVFKWFTEDGLDYREITRRLRREQAPPPPKVDHWTWRAVRNLLDNRRYTGDWSYGVKEIVWQSAADYGRQFKRAEPLLRRQDESLRIIDDVLFSRAQEILIKLSATRGGRKRRRPDGTVVVSAVKNLLWCETHQQYLKPAGGTGDQLVCRACKQDVADGSDSQCGPLFSSANREVVLRLLCEAIAPKIPQDGSLVQMILASASNQIVAAQEPNPERIAHLESQIGRLSRDIDFVLNNLGDSDGDRRESEARLQQLRGDRATAQRELISLQQSGVVDRPLPDAQALSDIIANIGNVLKNAGNGDAASSDACRKILFSLTGGKISVTQQGEPAAKRGWLRGTFRLQLIETITANQGYLSKGSSEQERVEISLDFVEPSALVERSEQVKAMMDEGMMMSQIAKKLGISRAQATAAKVIWFEARDLPIPDGRARRSTLEQMHNKPPLYQEIAGRVMELFDKGSLITEIATQISVDINTIRSAVTWWHKLRGLSVPDGRTRRKSLRGKSRSPLDEKC